VFSMLYFWCRIYEFLCADQNRQRVGGGAGGAKGKDWEQREPAKHDSHSIWPSGHEPEVHMTFRYYGVPATIEFIWRGGLSSHACVCD
jgi:hypothetical protein